MLDFTHVSSYDKNHFKNSEVPVEVWRTRQAVWVHAGMLRDSIRVSATRWCILLRGDKVSREANWDEYVGF